MKIAKLNEMVGGWFVGDFEPSILRTDAAEVAVKAYAAGATETRHVHRIACEITLVVSGRVKMNGDSYGPGDIVLLEPGEPADFAALTDAKTVVVKLPSVKGDKHPC